MIQKELVLPGLASSLSW